MLGDSQLVRLEPQKVIRHDREPRLISVHGFVVQLQGRSTSCFEALPLICWVCDRNQPLSSSAFENCRDLECHSIFLYVQSRTVLSKGRPRTLSQSCVLAVLLMHAMALPPATPATQAGKHPEEASIGAPDMHSVLYEVHADQVATTLQHTGGGTPPTTRPPGPLLCRFSVPL